MSEYKLSIIIPTFNLENEIDNAFNEIVSSPDFILGEREMLSDYSSRNIDVTSIYDILPQRNLSDFQNEAYKPSFHFNKGNELLNEKDYANAIAEYDNSIFRTPTFQSAITIEVWRMPSYSRFPMQSRILMKPSASALPLPRPTTIAESSN